MTLTLEAGKYYKTRDGRKAVIDGHNGPPEWPENLRFCGWVDGLLTAQTWTQLGTAVNVGSELDLIAEWREPRQLPRKTCCWYESPSGVVYGSIHGPQHPTDKMLAKVLVSATEGDGMEQ